MNVSNARIKVAEIGMDDIGRLSARLGFEGALGYHEFYLNLANNDDVSRLIALMRYTQSNMFDDLKGKIIRRVEADMVLRGFGHPIDDNFVLIKAPMFFETTEEEIEKVINKN